MFKTKFNKLIAVFTATSLLLSFVVGPTAASAINNEQTVKEYNQIFKEFILPYSYGKITKSHFAGTDRVIINIQDLHCHPKVQKNISNIIETFDKKYGIKFTTVYAGDKKNDLSPHEPLSENAIKDLQAEVDRLYDIFVATVSRNRYLSESKIRKTQAATYFGQNAVIAGLADELSSNALKEISAQPLVISKVKIKGKNMTEDINELEQNEVGSQISEVESQINEVEKYKAEVLEITKLCKLAHAENKISEFIEQGLSAEQVKEKLLASVSNNQHEIVSAIYQKETVQENPVVAAAKARIK